MSDFLSINGSLSQSSFLKLKKNKKLKHLEISHGNIDDDWSLIGNLQDLSTISVKDSFVGFQSFYYSLFGN